MTKFSVFLIACTLAGIGCEDKSGAAPDKPAAAPVGTEAKSEATTPTKSVPVSDEGQWVTVKGKVVWDKSKGEAPKRAAIKPSKDEEVCAKDKDFNSEDWVVNPESGGIKNVVVWLAPEPTDDELKALKDKKLKNFPSFKAADVHPALAKPAKADVEIDQPCCRFVPHIVVAQTGQNMVIKNSAPVPHNAKWTSRENGEINPLIPSGGQYKLENALVAEKFPIEVACSIHPWMKAWVRVFDHPYFAVTDGDGNFEIKNAPVLKGKLRIFIWQETGGLNGGAEGRFGQTVDVKPGTVDLKEIKFSDGK